MILVREVFHVDPEHMKEAKEALKAMSPVADKLGMPPRRLYSDLTGDYYTLVMESEHAGLAEFEKGLREAFANPEWQSYYPRFRRFLRGGRREIYTVIV